MKTMLIRLLLFSSIYFITTGFYFCDEDEPPPNAAGTVAPLFPKVGTEVVCDATASEAMSVRWEITQKPSLSNAEMDYISQGVATFIPDKEGTYKIKLRASNGEGNDDAKDFTVIASEEEVNAVAGNNQIVNIDSVVTLNGFGSYGNQLIAYQWTVLQSPVGANTIIDNSSNVLASYLVDKAGEYFVQLEVTDITLIKDYDTLKITATDVPMGDIWTTLTDYPGEGTQGIVAVSIDSFGYVGLGATTTNIIKKDFWKFDPLGNGGLGSWTQLNDFPANDTRDCAAFVINNKIYVGLGSSANPVQTAQIFYVYDPSTNSWDDGSDVQLFPGAPRQNASAFVLDGEAYVGLGYQNSFPSQLFNDMYKYNSTSNEWEPLNSFEGGARYAAISFVLNNTAYIGYGIQSLASGYIDLWSYNKSSDDWTSVQPIQPLTSSDIYYHSIGVATSTNAYLIGGGLQQTDNAKQVWAFNSSTWTRKTNSIAQLIYAAGFVINDKIFCGGGGNKKWYRYDPVLDVTNKKFSITEANRNNKR